MKIALRSLAFLFIIVSVSSSIHAQINLDSGLVACYPFNGNAIDASGNGNNGTVYGATLTADRFGNPNSAYSFDGVSNYIELPSTIQIQDNLSVSFWVQTTQSNPNGWYTGTSLIDRDICSPQRDWATELGNGGEFIFNTGTVGIDYPLNSVSNINNGSWTHIVFIRDSLAAMKYIYINGALDTQSPFDDQPFANNYLGIFLGASACQVYSFYQGNMDDICFYNRVLDVQEIDSLFHGGHCGSYGPVPVASFQSSDTTVCAYDCINFTDLSTNVTSWQWSFAGALDSISTAQNPQNVCYSVPGTYNVTLIASNANGSDSVTISNFINVKPSPPTPYITQQDDHDTLYCSTSADYSTYQWYSDSALIAGAIDTFLVITKSGNYNVRVTNVSGCSTAVGINIILGIQNYVADNVISISPNPAKDKFTIYDSRFTIERVEIYNVLGQETLSPPLFQSEGSAAIDVSKLDAGIYFVRVVSENRIWVGKFVKE